MCVPLLFGEGIWAWLLCDQLLLQTVTSKYFADSIIRISSEHSTQLLLFPFPVMWRWWMWTTVAFLSHQSCLLFCSGVCGWGGGGGTAQQAIWSASLGNHVLKSYVFVLIIKILDRYNFGSKLLEKFWSGEHSNDSELCQFRWEVHYFRIWLKWQAFWTLPLQLGSKLL